MVPGKVHKAETWKETNHNYGKESRDSSRLREQLRSPKGVEICWSMVWRKVAGDVVRTRSRWAL